MNNSGWRITHKRTDGKECGQRFPEPCIDITPCVWRSDDVVSRITDCAGAACSIPSATHNILRNRGTAQLPGQSGRFARCPAARPGLLGVLRLDRIFTPHQDKGADVVSVSTAGEPWRSPSGSTASGPSLKTVAPPSRCARRGELSGRHVGVDRTGSATRSTDAPEICGIFSSPSFLPPLRSSPLL